MEVTTFLFVALSLVALTGRCYSLYYEVRPTVAISVPSSDDFQTITRTGEYDPNYSNTKNDIISRLYVIEDKYSGCPEYFTNISLPLPRSSAFVVMLPLLGENSPCHEFLKAKTARNTWGASGVIFQYNPANSQGVLRHRPSQYKLLSGVTIVALPLSSSQYSALLLKQRGGYHPVVHINAQYHQIPASQTFYFIVFAFCILMLLSCLWFVMSYVKRCHYSIQRRRRRVSPPFFISAVI